MHSAGQPKAPVIDKLGMHLVRVLPDSAPPENANQPPFLHVATPAGKAGFVPAELDVGARQRPDVLRQGRRRLEDHRVFRRRRGVTF